MRGRIQATLSLCTQVATLTSLIKAALPASPSWPSPVGSAVLYKVLRLRFHACVSYTAGSRQTYLTLQHFPGRLGLDAEWRSINNACAIPVQRLLLGKL